MLLGEQELERARSALVKAKVLLCQLEISSHITLQALRMARQSNGQWVENTDGHTCVSCVYAHCKEWHL